MSLLSIFPLLGSSHRDLFYLNIHLTTMRSIRNLNTQTTGFNFQPILKFLGVFSSPEKGAYTSLYVAASADFKSSDSGDYYSPVAKKSKPSKHAQDAEMAKKLWDWTETELKGKKLI